MRPLSRGLRDSVRDLSLARKIIALIMGVSSTALLLACLGARRLRQFHGAHQPDP